MSGLARAYGTRAIVLRARHLGEADKIYTLFTELRGKLDAVAKGVRRARSSFAGRLEFMTEATLTLHRGRNLDVITSAEIHATGWRAIVEPEAFATAHVIAELVDAFSEPDLPMPEVYALLEGVLAALARGREAPTSLLPRFELRLLHALGLGPAADACVRCGAPFAAASDDREAAGDERGERDAPVAMDRVAWTDVENGGLACMACRSLRGSGEIVDLGLDDVANLHALAMPRSGGPVRATGRATGRAARAIDAFLHHHLGKRPKSHVALESLLGLLPTAVSVRSGASATEAAGSSAARAGEESAAR